MVQKSPPQNLTNARIGELSMNREGVAALSKWVASNEDEFTAEEKPRVKAALKHLRMRTGSRSGLAARIVPLSAPILALVIVISSALVVWATGPAKWSDDTEQAMPIVLGLQAASALFAVLLASRGLRKLSKLFWVLSVITFVLSCFALLLVLSSEGYKSEILYILGSSIATLICAKIARKYEYKG